MKALTLIVIMVVLLSACGSIRKSTEVLSAKKDSTLLENTTQSRDSVSCTKTLLVRDSVISIPARQVKDTLNPSALQPAYTKDGVSVKRSYTADTRGAHAFLNVLPNGAVEYGCNADSLSVVVRSLVKENTELHGRYDSIQTSYSSKNQNNITVQHSSVIKTRSFLAAAWPYLLALAVIMLAAYLVKRFLKWPL